MCISFFWTEKRILQLLFPSFFPENKQTNKNPNTFNFHIYCISPFPLERSYLFVIIIIILMERQECQSPFCGWETPCSWRWGRWGAVVVNTSRGIGLISTCGKEIGESVRVCPEHLGVCWSSPMGVLSWWQWTACVLTAVELCGYQYVYIWYII